MAYVYGVNKGDNEYKVTVASTTQTKDVEIQVNASNVTDRQSLITSLQNLMNQIIRSPYPPL